MHGERYCQQCSAELPGGVFTSYCPTCFEQRLQEPPEPDSDLDPDSLPTERMTVMFDIEPFDPLMPTKDQKFGDYELLDQIAQGGMGLVFKARQISLNRIVALKVIRAGQLASPTDVQRFRIEAEAAAHLDHPRIVPIYEIGELKGIHYFSMKLVEGGNLAQHMPRYVKDHQAAARLMAAAARGIHYAHQRGVLHRDLKPANILVDQDGRPHVTDFGVAKRVGGTCLDGAGGRLNPSNSGTLSGGIVGTPSYMAPEQAAGKRNTLTLAVDIYSLGAILYEMLTGRPPFKAATQMATLRKVLEERPLLPRAINPKVDRTLEAICLKCLQREPADRYHSAEDLVNDLDRWLANEPIEMQRGNAWVRTVKWAKRRPTTAAMVAATAAVTLLGMVGVLWEHRQAQAQQDLRLKSDEALVAEQFKAEQAVARLRIEQYADRIEDAQRLFRANDLDAAREALAACPNDLRGWEWSLLDRLCQTGTRQFQAPWGNVVLVASASSSLLALANHQGEIAVLDTASGQVRHSWSAHPAGIWALAISDSGKHVASSGRDGGVKVWDGGTGELLLSFLGYAKPAYALAFRPHSEQLAMGVRVEKSVGRAESAIHVFDLARIGDPKVFALGAGDAEGLAFSSDGRLLAAGLANPGLRVWNLQSADAQPIDLTGSKVPAEQICFAPDGQRLAAACGDHTLRVWQLGDLATTDPATTMVQKHGTSTLCFAPDGVTLTSASGNDVLSWDSVTGRLLSKQFGPTFVGAAYSPDGQYLMGVSVKSGTVSSWPVARREGEIAIRGFTEPVRGISVSPDGRLLLCITGQPTFKLWDAQLFRPLQTIATGEVPLVAGGFSADGRHVISLDQQGKVQVWDPASGDEIVSFATGVKDASCLAISQNGQLAVSGAGGNVEIWDATRRQLITKFDAAEGPVQVVRFSPDGQKLATGGSDHAIRLWDARSGVELLALRGHTGPVLDLVFAKDGDRLVSSGVDQTARVWELGNGQELLVLRGHTGPVRTVNLTPDGKRIVTGGQDRTLRVWDAGTGTAFLTLPAAGPVHAACVTPDGRCWLVGSEKIVQAWIGEP